MAIDVDIAVPACCVMNGEEGCRMSDAKLMMPLFCNGMFNCGGRRIRAVHLYDVSDGEHRYRLWTKAGTPDIDYPRVESDRYLLYVEITDTSHRLA